MKLIEDDLDLYILSNTEITSIQNTIKFYENGNASIYRSEIDKLKLELKNNVTYLIKDLFDLKAMSIVLNIYYNKGLKDEKRANDIHRQFCPSYHKQPLDIVEVFTSFQVAHKRGMELCRIVNWDIYSRCDYCKPYIDIETIINQLELLNSSEPFSDLYK